jgi:hypothetical protein
MMQSINYCPIEKEWASCKGEATGAGGKTRKNSVSLTA